MNLKISFYILICLVLQLSCSDKQIVVEKPSFYYWKMNVNDTNLQSNIEAYQIEHVYVKWFDIDWLHDKKQPGPIAVINSTSNIAPLLNIDHSPVVFINNNVFKKIDSLSVEALANNIVIALQNKSLHLANHSLQTEIWAHIKEIQIDCDWTPSTKNIYFSFLKHFKSLLPNKQVSVTLRLYPYKYPNNMGVPPVDKAVLMCYNMDQIKNVATKNSIFDISILKQYISNKLYPITLELALPTFGWYAWFRNNQFKGIVYNAELNQIKSAIDSSSKHLIKVNKEIASTFNYFKTGDILRSEFPTNESLIEGYKIIKKQYPNINKIHYFYLDDNTFPSYEKAIETIHNF